MKSLFESNYLNVLSNNNSKNNNNAPVLSPGKQLPLYTYTHEERKKGEKSDPKH